MIKRAAAGGGKPYEELATVCVLDICRAASHLENEKEPSVLHELVMTAKNDIQDRLFDISKPLMVDKVFIAPNEQYGSAAQEQRGGTMVDIHCLLVTALTTLYRLNPRKAIHSIFPMCLDNHSPIIYKSALARSLRILIDSSRNKVHQADSYIFESEFFYKVICQTLRQTLISYVTNVSGSVDGRVVMNPTTGSSNNVAGDNKKAETKSVTSQTAGLDDNEKLHAIWEILYLCSTDPKLIIMVRSSVTWFLFCQLYVLFFKTHPK